MKVLHFADAHIDMANYGRHDANLGLPLRVLDFLKSLDTIVDAAIHEKVDLVLFAGDAYKDRSPAPTFQREWGKRIMRLSRAGIPTLLLVGNHDTSPATGRAFSFQEFETLEVPHVQLIFRPGLLKPDQLEGLPIQIIAIPWINRAAVAAAMLNQGEGEGDANRSLEAVLVEMVNRWLNKLDPTLPTIMLAHGSVEGAIYGGERSVMLGGDFTLPRSLVRDPHLDYTALGHIHKMQNLNEGSHPPVVYPGSIERVDAGEAGDDKFYVIAEVNKGSTQFEFHKLTGIRKFINREVTLDDNSPVTEQLTRALEPQAGLNDAIVRLTAHFSREKQAQIDEQSLREFANDAFEFHFIQRPESDMRIRLPQNMAISSLTPLDLAEMFWKEYHWPEEAYPALRELANQVIAETQEEDESL